MNKKRKVVQEEIRQAFADAVYPGDEEIRILEDWEADEVQEWLRGKRWEDLNLDDLSKHSGALWFLSPEAYRYYLPAYLLASLEKSPENVYGDLISSFAQRWQSPSNEEMFQERTSVLTRTQKKAVYSFFKLMSRGEGEESDERKVLIALGKEWESDIKSS